MKLLKYQEEARDYLVKTVNIYLREGRHNYQDLLKNKQDKLRAFVYGCYKLMLNIDYLDNGLKITLETINILNGEYATIYIEGVIVDNTFSLTSVKKEVAPPLIKLKDIDLVDIDIEKNTDEDGYSLDVGTVLTFKDNSQVYFRFLESLDRYFTIKDLILLLQDKSRFSNMTKEEFILWFKEQIGSIYKEKYSKLDGRPISEELFNKLFRYTEDNWLVSKIREEAEEIENNKINIELDTYQSIIFSKINFSIQFNIILLLPSYFLTNYGRTIMIVSMFLVLVTMYLIYLYFYPPLYSIKGIKFYRKGQDIYAKLKKSPIKLKGRGTVINPAISLFKKSYKLDEKLGWRKKWWWKMMLKKPN